ncbi:Haloacid dehalogenase domain protein hydrolase [Planctopirus limnophila DSM 3776]|uniref:Haloacid dehalogenase domain protein hydrolase n=2 Tax=Planctopirus limnophila (strain ATCC 43296 / DSM 3776 / IFAM 1008 / Mu 290) TaxID=521674 RepID=D5SUM3_PLAL2|nr:HAD family hydrolase [Planctopirus limnophila]ADG67075.1 Haloacid dehalogenase domain protein hydrolase [Planctopirus limnophila DSM 3776]
MTQSRHIFFMALAVVGMATNLLAEEPLPSWNDSAARRAILEYVKSVTTEGSPRFVPVSERIVTFDNDGTLWCEQPMYVQLAFALDRVRLLADKHPEWRTEEPFRAVIEKDLPALAKLGAKGLTELTMATHAGMTDDEFENIVTEWIRKARHPKFHRPYTECVYQPMLELLAFLRQHEFKTFIVSGAGIEFMRPWAKEVYGIPPEQVIGSSVKLKYELRDGKPVLVRLAELNFIDDQAGKPVGIRQVIGRRPVMAVGNSDGDYEMLEYVTSGPANGLGLIVHHTDAVREFAYDRQSPFGRLDRALTDATSKGWIVIDMQRDWKVIFPESRPSQN